MAERRNPDGFGRKSLTEKGKKQITINFVEGVTGERILNSFINMYECTKKSEDGADYIIYLNPKKSKTVTKTTSSSSTVTKTTTKVVGKAEPEEEAPF